MTQAAPAVRGLVREGDTIVAEKGATLPARCIVCGTPADGQPIKCVFAWNPRPVRGNIGTLITAATNKHSHVNLFVCAEHKRKSATLFMTWGLIALVLLGGGAAFAAMSEDQSTARIIGAIGLVAGLLVGVLWLVFFGKRRTIHFEVVKIDQGRIWLKPNSMPLLNAVPTAKS
jgi:hypothetical protein